MSGINEQVINAEIYQIGPQGIPGEAATVSVGTVTTGEPGTDASVTNSGTSSAAILDFVIPQGEQGLQGIQGPQGIQGLTGATGNGISSIEKITTVGLTDTYRITFTNNTYYDFEVINGSSISDIEKTNTSGLVDTYTITLTNGNTHTFTVTNGAKGDKGETGEVGNGILGVNKMSTTGLVDNYRMTFTNGTYFDFDVTNAKSIVSISKISTSGLIDTYRITFNDNTNFQFPVTNGRGVTGVTLLSWEGLEKTYRMSFNDGTHFDFAVTNGAGSQVDWGGIYGVLSQQTDLQDALVQSNGLTMGSVSTYNVLLKELIERAHSTFDLSKFTVVGSPNITDDRIASGFSVNNVIRLANTYDVGSYDTWMFKGEFTTDSLENLSGTKIILAMNANYGKGLGYNQYKQLYLALNSANNNTYDIASQYIDKSTILLTPNTKYYYRFYFTGTQYLVDISTDKITWTNYITVTNSTHIWTNSSTAVYIGNSALKYAVSTFSFDLKEFEFIANGIPVFSGNKTGIDTIKPDDYSVVGTPTISADGIASGLTQSNYIYVDNFNCPNRFVFKGKFKPTTTTLKQRLFNIGESELHPPLGLACIAGRRYQLFITSDNTNIASFYDSTDYCITLNVWNYYKFSYDGSVYKLETSTDDENYTTVATITSSEAPKNTAGKLAIGSIVSDMAYVSFEGSIDLNAFKIYVDGNLVYQPCLKIPYTQSKTGSKIVNAVYRDRVNDMAEQFGYANYYTLSDTDFTLPQGELYGMIGDKTLRDSYYNGVTYWELFSNRRLEQGGSCESGVEYTLPKPFADANYVLTIPYSSKTATSFIPSATGDFIAKGMGLL